MSDQTSDSNDQPAPNAAPPVSDAAYKAAMDVVEIQMRFWDRSTAQNEALPEAEHVVIGGIDIAELMAAGREVNEIVSIIAPYLESEPHPVSAIPAPSVTASPVSEYARGVAMGVVYNQLKAWYKCTTEQHDLPEDEHIIIGGIDVAHLIAKRKNLDEIVNTIAPHLELETATEPIQATALVDTSRRAALHTIRNQMYICARAKAVEKREITQSKAIIIGGVNIAKSWSEGMPLEQIIDLIAPHLEGPPMPAPVPSPITAPMPTGISAPIFAPDPAPGPAPDVAQRTQEEALVMQAVSIHKRGLNEIQHVEIRGINISELVAAGVPLTDIMDRIAQRIHSPTRPYRPLPPLSGSAVARKAAGHAVGQQMDLYNRVKCRENRDFAESEQIIIGGFNIAKLMEQGFRVNHIVDLIVPHLEAQSEPRPETPPDPVPGLPPAPIAVPGPQSFHVYQDPQYNIPTRPPIPTAQQVKNFVNYAPDSAWANFDITAGNPEGLWKAVEELPEETLADVRAIMIRKYGSAYQGLDGQHDQGKVDPGHDESEQNMNVENENELEYDETRQNSFLDEGFLGWLDDEIEKKGSTPQGPKGQHGQGIVDQGGNESEQSLEVEAEKGKNDDESRQDSFLDDGWGWLYSETEKTDSAPKESDGQRDEGTVGQHDEETVDQHDRETIDQHDNESVGQHDNERVGQHDNERVGQHDNESVSQHDNETDGQHDKGTIGHDTRGTIGQNPEESEPRIIEPNNEKDDDDTRQDSFLDDDYLDWLDSEIEKRDDWKLLGCISYGHW